jgi:hypothetical protein
MSTLFQHSVKLHSCGISEVNQKFTQIEYQPSLLQIMQMEYHSWGLAIRYIYVLCKYSLLL